MPKQTYTVKSNDSYAKLAGQFYGDQRYFNILMEANGGGVLHPGDVLVIPDVSGYQKKLKQSGETHYVSPGLWDAVQQQEAALGWQSGPGNPYQQPQQPEVKAPSPAFPPQSQYANAPALPGANYNQPGYTQPGGYTAPPAGAPPGTAGVPGLPGVATPVPPGTIYNQTNQQPSSLDITVPQYTTPGGRPITPQQNAQYNIGYTPRPVGPQVPDLNQPSTTGILNGVSGSQLALMLDAPLTRQKAPGTYQVPQVSGYGWTPSGYQPTYGGYANSQVSGGKPGTYLMFDRIAAMQGQPWKTIGGGEGYPDLALPWTEWAAKYLPYPDQQQGAPAGGGGGGSGYYGGGGGGQKPQGGGYGPRAQAQPGLTVRAGRSYVPSNFTPFPFFGNSGVRPAGVREAESAGVVALTSWTL